MPHARLAASELSGITKKTEWPPNSPDLDLLDYRIWDAMLEK